MKKVFCLVLSVSLLFSFAISEELLPQPDENGTTIYYGKVGALFDENGEYIKESLFDEAVIWIQGIPGVTSASIWVGEATNIFQNKFQLIMIAIITSPFTRTARAKEMVETAARMTGCVLSMLDEYDEPTSKTYGSLFDEYVAIIMVADTNGDEIVKGTMNIGNQRLVW